MVSINGKTYNYQEVSLSVLLSELGIDENRVVVEVNQEIINREIYTDHCIKSGDVIEVVKFVGGG